MVRAAASTGLSSEAPLVQYVINDRYPLHYGAAGTIAVITGAVRLAELGYRLQLVDLTSELLEGDPHARNVCSTLVKAISSRRWDITPAETEPGDEEGERVARVIASFVKSVVKRIPHWRAHVAGLLWGIIYGVSAREIMWKRGALGEYLVASLRLVHTRRLGYDWDWNLVWSDYGQSNNGNPLRDYPGKFVVFEPVSWDEYQTREGLCRTLCYWCGFKRFDVRGLVGYVERFGSPYPQVTWKTGREQADEDDIAIAKRLAKDIGRGSLAGVAYPDTVSLAITGNGANSNGSASGENTPHKALIQLCDEQTSKLVLGQAYTTNSGQATGGLGGKNDIFANASQLIFVDYSGQIAEAITRDLLWWITALNFGKDKADKYCPVYSIEIEDPEDADLTASRIEKMVKVGQPVGVKFVSERLDIPMPKPGEEILGASGSASTYQSDGEEESEEDSEPKEDEEPESDEPKPKPAKDNGEDDVTDAGVSSSKGTDKPKKTRPKKPLPKDGGTPKRYMEDIPLLVPPGMEASHQELLDAWEKEARAILFSQGQLTQDAPLEGADGDKT